MQALSPAENGCQCLDPHAHDVIFRLLCGEQDLLPSVYGSGATTSADSLPS